MTDLLGGLKYLGTFCCGLYLIGLALVAIVVRGGTRKTEAGR